ncbi:MAG TPA: HD domain-containing phosphohydrolase [Bryobacteraceae bacterium]|nr:HD domain-containing phosphohydrolase [Bryobacteraceae bacterium]
MEPEKPQRIPIPAKLFIATIGLAGLAGMAFTFQGWVPDLPPRFMVYLLLAIATSGMKVAFPGVRGTISLNFVIIMLSLVELKATETMFLAVASAAAQTCWHAKARVKPVRLFFNTTCVALAVLAATWVYHEPWFMNVPEGELLRLTFAGVAYFIVNNVPIAIVIALTEEQNIQAVIRSVCDWLFFFYLVGVSVAELVHTATERLGWAFSLALLPPLYLIYRSIRLYFGKVEQDRAHAESMAALHLRTIEALATAIEAKDECTGDHLRRVQVYSLELAKHLGLASDEVNALQAASILHDIGKLAVPDYIISKPGKLTPDEFDKMKVHTVVGAEILEQVAFPYPVAPIVRSHHEKWDGSGYPDGLKAEDIPIGARILSAVDCLDALASDRQYRRALPLDEAMDYVAGLSAKSFDPQVVDILKANYREFERLAQSTPLRNHKLSKDLIVGEGKAPDAGYEKSASAAAGASGQLTQTDSIASARQEMRVIVDLALDLSKSLRTEDILSILAARLKQLVPYDCMVIYVREKAVLKARFTTGTNSQRFSSIEIPVGQGLSGWVVENGKAIVNGNPAVEPGYVDQSGQLDALNSALSIPLGDGLDQLSGALTLYRAEKDAYSADHLRILLAIKGDIARAVDGSIRFQQAQQGAGADELTGLPARTTLLAYLQEGFARQHKPVTILLCDIHEFRRVNELFGRSTGDELLKLATNILRNNSRSGDYVARTGADEFAMLLAAARPEELAGKIESLDRLVANACRGLCGEESSGLAVGVACFPENGADADTLMAFAEQALARAKEARRASRNVLLQFEESVRRPA